MSRRHTDWVFTINNPQYIPDLTNENVRYYTISEEVGITGNHHFQGFLQLYSQKSMRWIKRNLDHMQTAHLEPRYGTVEQAVNYAQKTDHTTIESKLEEWGESTSQGKRNDIVDAMAAVSRGATQKEIAQTYPRIWLQYRNGLSEYRSLVQSNPVAIYPLSQFIRPPLDLSKPVLLFGGSGIGKTQYALAHFNKPLLVTHIDDLKKLEDHDGIVFDDMSFRHWPAESIINLLQWETPASVHCRFINAHMPARMPRIFTTNDPDIFLPEKPISADHQYAIERRIQRIDLQYKLLFSRE